MFSNVSVFWKDETGFSQVTTFVLAIYFMLLICGLSIDMTRLRLVQGNLVVACDSASLSGALTAEPVKDSIQIIPMYDNNGNLIGLQEIDEWKAKITSPEVAENSALSSFLVNATDLTSIRGVSFDTSGDWRSEVVGDDSYKVSARARVRTIFAGAVGLLVGNSSFVNIPVSATGTARAVVKEQ
ncbi:MAG: Tad domain-containing protein [Bacillota bacterium]